MSRSLPAVTGREVLKALVGVGFVHLSTKAPTPKSRIRTDAWRWCRCMVAETSHGAHWARFFVKRGSPSRSSGNSCEIGNSGLVYASSGRTGHTSGPAVAQILVHEEKYLSAAATSRPCASAFGVVTFCRSRRVKSGVNTNHATMLPPGNVSDIRSTSPVLPTAAASGHHPGCSARTDGDHIDRYAQKDRFERH